MPLVVVSFSAHAVNNCKYLISRGANLAQLDISAECTLETILKKVPRAMTAVQERLDEGLFMARDHNKIELDFSKIFGSNRGKHSRKEHEMLLFRELASASEPFRSYVEHPLCQAFVSYKFRHVKYLYWLFSLIPHLLLSGKFLALTGDQEEAMLSVCPSVRVWMILCSEWL